MEPRDVAFAKVDVEGYDVQAFHGLQRILQEGRVPYLTIEYNSRMANEQARCDAVKFMRHMHTIGYRCVFCVTRVFVRFRTQTSECPFQCTNSLRIYLCVCFIFRCFNVSTCRLYSPRKRPSYPMSYFNIMEDVSRPRLPPEK